MANACNPSYSGGRDQEDLSSKPAWANSSRDAILKKILQKRRAGGGVAQGVGLELNSSTTKKKKKKQEFLIYLKSLYFLRIYISNSL
jgi:hypothetical protein